MKARVFLVLSVGIWGCGKGGGGGGAGEAPKMDSPKATAAALAQAFKDRSTEHAVALMPTDELVKKHFDCPGDELVKRLAQKRARVTKDFEKVPAGTQVDVGTFDKPGTEEKLYKPGEDFEGCKVKAPVTLHKSRLELRITKDGKIDYDDETWRFFKFGDEEKWYVVD